MRKINGLGILIILLGVFSTSCDKGTVELDKAEKKEFISSFETADDFSGFYITPQNHLRTTFHELSDTIVHQGAYAHKAWISGINPPSSATINNNHRGYPTIQFQKTSEGVFKTPCYITIWVWLDMELQESTTGEENDWFSFATFTNDESDNWERTVLVNLSHEGFVHLGNVPKQGQQTHIFQTSSIPFPQKEWIELKIYLDFGTNGYAKVWQNGALVSYAKTENLENKLSQIHFGMYAPPQMKSGVIYNDNLKIVEVDKE